MTVFASCAAAGETSTVIEYNTSINFLNMSPPVRTRKPDTYVRRRPRCQLLARFSPVVVAAVKLERASRLSRMDQPYNSAAGWDRMLPSTARHSAGERRSRHVSSECHSVRLRCNSDCGADSGNDRTATRQNSEPDRKSVV